MPRKRRKTETLGMMATVAEYAVVKEYVTRNRLTITEYLRQAAIRPLMEAQVNSLEQVSGETAD